MTIRYARAFLRQREKLPVEVRRLLRVQEMRFQEHWLDSRLQVKRLREYRGLYSFRVTRRYRVFFLLPGAEGAVFVAIGHRKEIYRG